MKIRTTQIFSAWRPLLQDIGQVAHTDGLRVFAVGGFVRDVLLRRTQADLDVSVEGDAIRLARRVAEHWAGRAVTHPRFGTATVRSGGRPDVDFAMLRQERYPHPGALPVVGPGTLEQDLFRRDFTVNALALGLHPSQERQVVDMFNGVDDLQAGRIRVLHEKSFLDDPTRILRAVRFEQRFDFRIEPQTLRWLRAALDGGAVATVKPPRYFQEFRKGLHEESVLKFLRRLYALGGLDFLNLAAEPDWPELQRRSEQHADAGSRACGVLAGLLAVQDNPGFEEAVARFGLTRREKTACNSERTRTSGG